jgi:hypothetical protein
MVGEAYGGHVWLEKLTDDANVWLKAIRMEEQGELGKAAVLYLEDAAACLESSTVVRAALGATCAADCMVRLGLPENGRRLYHVAGMLYWDNADARLGTSVRESLWSLQEAYEGFLLAGEEENAKKVRQLYASLARRANPFIGERDAFTLPTKRDLAGETKSEGAMNYGQESSELVNAFERFLAAREQQRERDNGPKRPVVSEETKEIQEVEMLDAQSFVGQLG